MKDDASQEEENETHGDDMRHETRDGRMRRINENSV